MMAGPLGQILVVEDERRLAAVVQEYLQAAGYGTRWLADGTSVLAECKAHEPDLIVLDLSLPGSDGLDVCRALRRESMVPIVMVTARVEEVDRLLGLEAGADDYICKPFSPRELVARVHAVLRRHRLPPAEPGIRGLHVDVASGRATLRGHSLNLTPVEFRLLHTLSSAPGRIFSRDQLMERLYSDNRTVTDRTVDSHVKNLRRKLAQGAADDWIRSIYGVGYRFEQPSPGRCFSSD